MALKQLPMIRERGVCCALPTVNAAWVRERTDLMKALADPTRLVIVASLWKAASSVCVCDFVASLELSQPTISHHMAKLKEAGLIDSEKQGIWIYYRLRDRLPSSTRKLLSQLLD